MKSCRCRAGCILMRLAELEGSQADLLVACVRGSPVQILLRVLEIEVVEVVGTQLDPSLVRSSKQTRKRLGPT